MSKTNKARMLHKTSSASNPGQIEIYEAKPTTTALPHKSRLPQNSFVYLKNNLIANGEKLRTSLV